VKQSMIKALANVAPRHLLDTRLNPPADLVRRVESPAAASAVATQTRTINAGTAAETVVQGERQIAAISATAECETRSRVIALRSRRDLC